jgi:hypothetical protein
MEPTTSSVHNPSAALPKSRAEQPMVVYDLSKSTATVLTANTTFCQMIGYELVCHDHDLLVSVLSMSDVVHLLPLSE